MINMPNGKLYQAFGLTISSEIDFPELLQVFSDICLVDVKIEINNSTAQWSELANDEGFQVKDDLVSFKIPDAAIFSIENGEKISVSPLGKADFDEIRLYILGSCMGVILFQRRILPLHGSCVSINGRAYAIVGVSGAGKSTLASALINKGLQLITDDVIPVTLSEDFTPYVTPSYPQQKLWNESLDLLGVTQHEFRSIFGRETKYCVPISNFEIEKQPLSGIIELAKWENPAVQINRIQNLEKFRTLYQHTYRNFFLEPMNLVAWHFNYSAKIISKTELHGIKRPINENSINEIVDRVLNIFEGGKKDAHKLALIK